MRRVLRIALLVTLAASCSKKDKNKDTDGDEAGGVPNSCGSAGAANVSALPAI